MTCSTSKASQPEVRGRSGERGVVYLEFLFAFIPLFLVFLAVVQLALIASARVVVGQAANQAARSAAVVLEDWPDYYDEAPRGDLSAGEQNPDESIEALLELLELADGDPPSPPDAPQFGARMGPVRTAAYGPLLMLSPHQSAWEEQTTVESGARAGFLDHMDAALSYMRAASAVSIVGEGTQLVEEPVKAGARVTVRVEYFYQCAIPIIRLLLCNSLEHFWGDGSSQDGGAADSDTADGYTADGHATNGDVVDGDAAGADTEDDGDERFRDFLRHSEMPGALRDVAPSTARFVPLVARAELPSQGADYYEREEKKEKE